MRTQEHLVVLERTRDRSMYRARCSCGWCRVSMDAATANQAMQDHADGIPEWEPVPKEEAVA